MCNAHRTSHSPTSTDQSAATSAFVERLVGMLNGSGLMLMISLGHRTGLFDVMSTLPGSTSHEIAAAARLSERYVREWLGAMVTGGIVNIDPDGTHFTLPPEHAACLTRAATPGNFAVTAQWIGLLGSVESHVEEAFRTGRGVPYQAYRGFHAVMAEESSQTVVAALEEHILPLAPGLAHELERGIDVLDVGCGMGLALCHLAGRFPRSRFVGVDFSPEAIEAGRREAAARGIGNLTLAVGDAATFGTPDGYDAVLAFDAIHDQARPAAVLKNVRRVLRSGGTFLMQDIKARTAIRDNIGSPLAPFTYAISLMHCMSVSLAAGGPGLGAAWGRELALRMLAEAGFRNVRIDELPHDPINYYYVMCKDAAAGRPGLQAA